MNIREGRSQYGCALLVLRFGLLCPTASFGQRLPALSPAPLHGFRDSLAALRAQSLLACSGSCILTALRPSRTLSRCSIHASKQFAGLLQFLYLRIYFRNHTAYFHLTPP